MIDVKNSELFESIKKELESRINKTQQNLEKQQQKLKDTNSKLGILEKISINSHVKSYQEDLKKLTGLNQSFMRLRFGDNDKFQFPSNVVSDFEKLGFLLSEQEISQLRENVNGSLNNINKGKKEVVTLEMDNIKKILQQLNLGDKSVMLVDVYNQYKGNATFDEALKEVEKTAIEKMTPDYFSIATGDMNVILEPHDQSVIISIQKMRLDDQLQKSNNMHRIMSNFDLIKEAFENKAKINLTLSTLSNTISDIQNIEGTDFSKLISFLEKLEVNYKKQLDKANSFLSKFDFDEVQKQVEEKENQEKMEKAENAGISLYEQLAYELNRLNHENPNNVEEIVQIMDKMLQTKIKYQLREYEIQSIETAAKAKYLADCEKKEIQIETDKKAVAYSDLEVSVKAQLRECAIQNLEARGAFEGHAEVRDGDVYYPHMSYNDREELIQKEMKELERIADMKPEQRGFEDLKKQGAIPFGTKLEDLPSQQLSDLRYAYRDETYSFIHDYKKLQEQKQVTPKANNIYRSYVKYMASLEDKTNALSFSQYAEQIYNVENINEAMVEPSLIEEERGMTR